MIKVHAPVIWLFLGTFFSNTLEKKKYLGERTYGIMTLIYKSGEADDPRYYIGITIDIYLRKLFTLLRNNINRLTNWINQIDFVNFNRIGLSKDFRTADLKLKTLIDEYLSKTKNYISVLLIFGKHMIVFDSIWQPKPLLENIFSKRKLNIRFLYWHYTLNSIFWWTKRGCNLILFCLIFL